MKREEEGSHVSAMAILYSIPPVSCGECGHDTNGKVSYGLNDHLPVYHT